MTPSVKHGKVIELLIYWQDKDLKMFNRKKQFNLSEKEKAIELIGIILFATVLAGSFLKVMFL